MTLLRTNAHEGTNGNTAGAVANSYDSTVGAGTAATYINVALIGSTSINFSPGVTAGFQFQENLTGPWTVMPFYIPAAPAATITFSRKRTAASALLGVLQVNTSRKLVVQSGAATVATSVTTLATNTWYQVVWGMPGDGTQTVLLYSAAGTLLETVGSAVAASAGTVGQVFVGQNTNSGATIYIDRHQVFDTQPASVFPQSELSAGTAGDTLATSLNRLAHTSALTETDAANVWAGTSKCNLVDALNIKAGNTLPNYKGLGGVLNQLASTTDLSPADAATRILG